jgi:hypothetical protein
VGSHGNRTHARAFSRRELCMLFRNATSSRCHSRSQSLNWLKTAIILSACMCWYYRRFWRLEDNIQTLWDPPPSMLQTSSFLGWFASTERIMEIKIFPDVKTSPLRIPGESAVPWHNTVPEFKKSYENDVQHRLWDAENAFMLHSRSADAFALAVSQPTLQQVDKGYRPKHYTKSPNIAAEIFQCFSIESRVLQMLRAPHNTVAFNSNHRHHSLNTWRQVSYTWKVAVLTNFLMTTLSPCSIASSCEGVDTFRPKK